MITVELGPETEAALAHQASLIGKPVEEYVASLLNKAAQHTDSRHVPADMVELFAPLRGLNMIFERDQDTGRDVQL